VAAFSRPSIIVIPAKAGIQYYWNIPFLYLDSRFRGNDEKKTPHALSSVFRGVPKLNQNTRNRANIDFQLPRVLPDFGNPPLHELITTTGGGLAEESRLLEYVPSTSLNVSLRASPQGEAWQSPGLKGHIVVSGAFTYPKENYIKMPFSHCTRILFMGLFGNWRVLRYLRYQSYADSMAPTDSAC
jgi:hypothetical protein